MRFAIFLVALTVLMALAKAQPVFEENSLIQAQDQDQSISTDAVEEADEVLVAEPPELADAMKELNRQEQEAEAGESVTAVDSHSRQKRAVCRCVRRGRRVVCVCARRRA